MIAAEARALLVNDLKAHLRLASEMAEDSVLAQEAAQMLKRVEANEPLLPKDGAS